MKTNLSLLMGLLAAGTLAPATVLAQTSCTDIVVMVDRALPTTVGDASYMQRLLDARPTSQLSRNFNPSRAASMVGSDLRPASTCKPFSPTDPDAESHACVYADERGNKMRVELASGKVIYINPDRSSGQGTITLSEDRAVDLALSAATSFGVPMDELSATQAQVKALRVASRDGETGRAMSRRTELHVRFQRRLAGTPVLGSKLHVAVDPDAQVARMHVRWPDFKLAPGLSARTTLSRSEVLSRTVDAINESNRCGSVAGVRAMVAYVKTRGVEGGGAAEEEESSTAPSGAQGVEPVVPALVVYVKPIEQAEDSGVPQEAGQGLVIPLLDGRDG
jgi:hypothetical protein